METGKGIMEEVRELLVDGLSSREAIDLGYAPGTVYKVQRQLRKKTSGTQGMDGAPTGAAASEFAQTVRDLQAEIIHLEAEIDRLGRVEQHAQVLEQQVGELKSSLGIAMEISDERRERSRELFNETQRLRQEAHEARVKNIRLQGYLPGASQDRESRLSEQVRGLICHPVGDAHGSVHSHHPPKTRCDTHCPSVHRAHPAN